ncbi:MAG: hypothetical protein AAF423_04895 [Pseudomonadota bacterium]
MSNVSIQQPASPKGGISEPLMVEARRKNACQCMHGSQLQAFRRLPDCVSIHGICGEALWVSERSFDVLQKHHHELEGDGFRSLFENVGDFEFTSLLGRSLLQKTEITQTVHLSTKGLRQALSVRFVPLDSCEYGDCEPRIMVITGQPPSVTAEKTQVLGMNSQLFDPVATIRSEFEKFSAGFGCTGKIMTVCDEEDIPSINSDPFLFSNLIGKLINAAIGAETGRNNVELSISRTARLLQIGIDSFAGETITSDHPGSGRSRVPPDVAQEGEGFTIEALQNALGTNLKLVAGEAQHWKCILSVPVNAGISLPDPSDVISEIVYVQKNDNGKSPFNPIPREQTTGRSKCLN